jgi:hypothetical protein
MHIHEFVTALENHNNDASFLGHLRTMATSLVEQAAQSFTESSEDGTFEFWSFPISGGVACQASA